VNSKESAASVSLDTHTDADMSAFNVVATCIKCSQPNALGSISELRFKQGQFRTPDRAHAFTCLSCGEKSIVKEHEVQLICGAKRGDKKPEN
jgi:RNase P subunit RPR2